MESTNGPSSFGAKSQDVRSRNGAIQCHTRGHASSGNGSRISTLPGRTRFAPALRPVGSTGGFHLHQLLAIALRQLPIALVPANLLHHHFAHAFLHIQESPNPRALLQWGCVAAAHGGESKGL